MAKKTKTLRISEAAEALLKKMAQIREATESTIIDEAIREKAKREKITIEKSS